MKLMVNNQLMDIPQQSTLSSVIEQFGASGQFAVALNGQFVSKHNYSITVVAAQDKIEILSPIQGG